MGSGVTKNFEESVTCVKGETQFEIMSGYKNKNLLNMNGNIYMKIEREEFKLKTNVLRAFGYYNNFSKDVEFDNIKYK
jgi:hypothetical protein